jgi:hypothetical protein
MRLKGLISCMNSKCEMYRKKIPVETKKKPNTWTYIFKCPKCGKALTGWLRDVK